MGDFQRIELQDAQAYLRNMVEMTTDITPLAEQGLAWTCEIDGEVMGCGGLVPQWEGRALIWAMVSRHAGRHFVEIHRAVRRFIEASPYRRIEATVDLGFPEGEKWLKMLGFQFDRVLPGYRPDGVDMLLYVRVRS